VHRGALLAFALVAGCEKGSPPSVASGTAHVRLDTRTAALVGGVAIPVSLVTDVARARKAPPRVALDLLIVDALAAEGGRAAGEDRDPSVAWGLEAIRASSTTERIRTDSRAAGPPTDAEVEELTRSDWRDVALPEQVKVVHAIVRRPKDASQEEAARALASQLAPSLAGAKNEDDFESRAKEFPHGPFEIIVEHLPAFVSDGRTAEGEPGSLDAAFVRAGFALRKPGDTSGVVASPFGWHVIRLVERRPPKVLPVEERRARFADEVYEFRGREALEAILSSRRSAVPIDIQPDAEALMATLWSTPPR
jgi:peptidyl-prolyl cis-trans isomerase C